MTWKFNGFKAKRNFHTILNFVLLQKYEMYESKYRTKICDFTVCCLLVFVLVFHDFLEFKAVSKFVKSWVVGKSSTIFYTADPHMVTDFRLERNSIMSKRAFYERPSQSRIAT